MQAGKNVNERYSLQTLEYKDEEKIECEVDEKNYKTVLDFVSLEVKNDLKPTIEEQVIIVEETEQTSFEEYKKKD